MFGPQQFDGGLLKFDWQNDLHLAKTNTATVGAEYEQENFNSNLQRDVTADTTSVYAQDAVSFADRLFLTGGAALRRPHHRRAETRPTVSPARTCSPRPARKLHASAGTGYKVPALSELFGTGRQPQPPARDELRLRRRRPAVVRQGPRRRRRHLLP